MTGHHSDSQSINEICANVKRLGFGVSQRVRLYGEEFEVMSDPFPEADGIAVHAKTKKDTVNAALREVGQRLDRLRALARLREMADQGDFDEFIGNKAAYRR